MPPEDRPVRYRVELFGLLRVGAARPIKVRLLDLSEGGAFIEQPRQGEEPQESDEVTLGLNFPDLGKWAAKARVCRLGSSRLELRREPAAHVTVIREGLGLEFVEIGDEALERLRSFLELLDQR